VLLAKASRAGGGGASWLEGAGDNVCWPRLQDMDIEVAADMFERF
jgi:hypothetical protein